MAGAPTPAVATVRQLGIAHHVHDCGGATSGDEVAAALGVAAARVLKTLVVDAIDRLVVAVVPVTSTLDLKAVAAGVGAKSAALADSGVARRATGYVIGGISPIGQKRRLTTLVDDDALAFPTVFVSAGQRGLELELSPTDLVALTDATVCRLRTH